jgi:hypothetical protein
MITIRRFIFIFAALLALAGPAAGQEYLRWGGGPKTPDHCLKWATDGSGRILSSDCATSAAVAARLFQAGPTSGGSGAPTFRLIQPTDLSGTPAANRFWMGSGPGELWERLILEPARPALRGSWMARRPGV